jgi:hypothetical protein
MRRTSLGRSGLLAAIIALVPSWAWAQTGYPGYAPHDENQLVTPLGSTRPEEGGFFVAGSYVMYRQTNPLKDQVVAVRGFIAVDDSILGPGTAGTFVGSRTEALNTHQVTGPNGYQPGVNFEGGWKFRDGSTVSIGFIWLSTAKTTAVATLAPQDLRVRSDFADSFLTAYVYNFAPEYAGPANKINVGNPFAVYGIWNGATVMTEVFEQRFSQYQATWRQVVYENEYYRLSSLFGPRLTWIWERYRWTTSDQDVNGNTDASWRAQYSNIVSNRLYGLHVGCSEECYLGHGVAIQLDTEAALFLNSVKETAKYELGTKFGPDNKRALRRVMVTPELQANLNLAWYPREGIQIRVGYDLMAFFNTISSPTPIDFNYGALTPPYERTFRVFDGFNAGIAFIF